MVSLNVASAGVELGGRKVLRDVSLAVAAGDVLALVGPNGAGKSTLMRVLAGELAPACGSVTIGTECLASMPHAQRARRLAIMPQHASLSFPFAVADVVAMGRAPFHGDGSVADNSEAVRWAMQATDVAALSNRSYTRLSGGEQQRVQLARVLAQTWRRADDETARFLLLDEPTSSLDLAHQHATLELARSLTRHAVGIVAAVHDLNLAALYADRVAVLREGRLVALGPPDDVLVPDLVAQVFGLHVRRIADAASGRHLILPLGQSGAGAAAPRVAAAE